MARFVAEDDGVQVAGAGLTRLHIRTMSPGTSWGHSPGTTGTTPLPSPPSSGRHRPAQSCT
ncbi:hypothetical protein [Modestobacter sp. DSM 44400]|uniref:hypothetical protein n=1 Tax=Modestobacter sp. DSM 44400 TaxID=1550230 RepID=UPI0011153821|nr:hypothetical protein [Modestobacter sp. DSM 44400]